VKAVDPGLWDDLAMCARLRGYPSQGAAVTVLSFGDPVAGVVIAVSADRRSLEVATRNGERLAFDLRRATGRFESADGRRLRFDD